MKYLAICLTIASCVSGWHTSLLAAVLPDLGDAASFTFLSMPNEADPNAEFRVSSSSTVSGNVGVGANGHYRKSGSGDINGNVYLSVGVTTQITGSGSPGTIITNANVSQAISDALAASAAAALLTPTQTLLTINGNFVLSGGGVYSVGSIDLSGTNELTLQGGPTDFFIFNISDYIDLSGNSAVVLDGIEASQVWFNLPTAGAAISLTSDINGVILAPYRDFIMHNASLTGAAYANDIWVTSGASIIAMNYLIPTELPPTVPEPASLMLLSLGALGLAIRKKR